MIKTEIKMGRFLKVVGVAGDDDNRKAGMGRAGPPRMPAAGKSKPCQLSGVYLSLKT